MGFCKEIPRPENIGSLNEKPTSMNYKTNGQFVGV